MTKETGVSGSELFIVDNTDQDWKVLKYLHDWCQISNKIDIATGYFEIGSLLGLRDAWQKVDKIRILMGDERDLASELGITLLPDTILSREELRQKIEAHLRKELSTMAGVEIIPNACIESETLLTLSLQHVPPFASDGDRGLRDTIIYQTVIQHIRTHGVAEAILLTKDDDFKGLPATQEKAVNLTVNTVETATGKLKEHLDSVAADQEAQKDKALVELISANAVSLEQWIADPNRFVFSEQLLQMRIGVLGATIVGGKKPKFRQVVRIERAPTDEGDPAKYKVTCEVTFSMALDITYMTWSENPTPLASGDSAGLIGITVVRSQFHQRQTGRAIIEYPVIFDILVSEENALPVRFQIIGVRDKDALLGALLAPHMSTRIEPLPGTGE